MNTAPVGASEAWSAREVLRRRAEELARPPEAPVVGARLTEILEFTLGRERYAFPSSCVREVFRLSEITPLPGLPAHILGVINVRGRILSVVDIRRLLELPSTGLSNLNKAIILRSREMELAVLADEVRGVQVIDADDEAGVLPTLSAKQAQYLKVVTRDRVAVLDGEKLLASRDLVVDGSH